ncbi:MAG: type III-B CRISPR module RAMP protein Cmr6 [Acidobacteria bacterium]|nr:type III-B CRISPR module RAMP protein Cmr6 [Acidobacteriota bacterium]
MRYPLPKDTASVLTIHNHPGLELDRYLQISDDGWDLTLATKKKSLPQCNSPLLKAVNARYTAMIESYKKTGHHPGQFTAVTDYRLVVGFGVEHVLETSLNLHRIYGIPLIPGSALKGVARAWAFWEIAQKLKIPATTPEERAQRTQDHKRTPLQQLDDLLSTGETQEQQRLLDRLKHDELCREVESIQSLSLELWLETAGLFSQVFGTTRHQGEVIFFDAYPKQAPRIELDILNPHYGKYYNSHNPPADYDKPIPTFFRAIGENTAFHFAVSAKNINLVETAKYWLVQAVTDLGVGGKTSAGYGFMKNIQ